jgi:hypothetical protein
VFAPSDPTPSHGLQWTAAMRDDAGHTVSLGVVVGGSPVTPDQVVIDLRRNDEPPVPVGGPLGWKVGERFVETSRPQGFDAVAARLSEYAAWEVAVTRDLDGLSAVVRPVLDRADYTVCDYGPSPGNGIPGPCNPRAPTDAERAAHRVTFDAELTRRRELALDPTWSVMLAELTPPF